MKRVALLGLLLVVIAAGLITLSQAPWNATAEGSDMKPGATDAESPLPAEREAASPTLSGVEVSSAPLALSASPASAAAPGWRGVVVDAHDRPLQDAEVGLVPSVESWSSHAARSVDPSLVSGADWVATDARGRFELPWKPPRDRAPWLLVVRHPRGLTRALFCEGPLESGGDVGTIRLAPGGTVRGRVIGADGAPLGFANVSLRTSVAADRVVDGPRLPYVDLAGALLYACTSPDGSFEIGGVPACEARAAVEARGHLALAGPSRPLPEGGELDFGDLRLERGNTVSGLVLDARGQPVAGAEVRATRAELEQVKVYSHGIHFQIEVARYGRVRVGEQHEAMACVTQSGPDGRFEIGSIETPACSVLADAPGHEPAALGDVLAGASDLVLRLGALGRLRLRVTGEPGGEPVTDATLNVQRVPDFDFSVGSEYDVVDVITAGPGEFLWQDACESPLVVTVTSPTWGGAVCHVDGLGVGESEASREIRLRRPASLRGRVTGTDGQPLPEAQVRLGPYGDDAQLARLQPQLLVVAADARFESEPVAAGHWVVTAFAPGRAGARREVWLEGSRGEDIGDLVLPRLAHVVARLLDADGRPVPQAWLHLRDSGSAPGALMALDSGQTDADGRAELVVAPGAVRLELSKPLILMDLGALSEGEAREVTLRCQPATRLSGTVRDADGPVADANVEFVHSLGTARATTDAAGSWSLDVEGSLTGSVNIRSPRGGLAQRSVSTAPGRDQVLDIVLGAGTLRGRVVESAGGAGRPGILVYAQRAAGTPFGGPVKCNADGRFEIGHLEDGEWSVVALRADSSQSEPVIAHVPPAAGAELTLSLTALASVHGTLRTSAGLPVTVPCSVRLYGAGDNTGDWDGTGASGAYEFLRLAPGDYEILVTRFSHLDGSRPKREDIEPLAWCRATVHLAPGARVEQDFMLPPGRP